MDREQEKVPQSNFSHYVSELNGYLNAIRCFLNYSGRVFGSLLIEKEEDSLEELVCELIDREMSQGQVSTSDLVEFSCIQTVFQRFIYSKLTDFSDEVVENIDWNIVEYFGLMSTSEQKGEWNRLVSQKSHLVE